jgi:hypothetical protein
MEFCFAKLQGKNPKVFLDFYPIRQQGFEFCKAKLKNQNAKRFD